MYDELIAALRFCDGGECDGCCRYKKGHGAECYTLLRDAADAIEERDRYALTIQHEMMSEAESHIALVERLNKQIEELRKPRWIPVTERLPEDGVYVLGRYKNNEMAVVSVFDHDEDFTFWRAQTDEGWEADCDTEPTHWMPLPEPPKEET